MTQKNARHETGQQITHRQHITPANKIYELTAKAMHDLRQPRCKRILKRLMANGEGTTADLAGNCAVGNVSDAILTMLPMLQKYGLTIEHKHPAGLKNRYGEKTQMHVWRLALLGGDA